MINISFANYLAHGIAHDPNATYFQTAFKSDVYVAECTFNNYAVSAELKDQTYPNNSQYANVASNVASVSCPVARSIYDMFLIHFQILRSTNIMLLIHRLLSRLWFSQQLSRWSVIGRHICLSRMPKCSPVQADCVLSCCADPPVGPCDHHQHLFIRPGGLCCVMLD